MLSVCGMAADTAPHWALVQHGWPGAPPHPHPGLHPPQYQATLPPYHDLPEVTDIYKLNIYQINSPIRTLAAAVDLQRYHHSSTTESMRQRNNNNSGLILLVFLLQKSSI